MLRETTQPSLVTRSANGLYRPSAVWKLLCASSIATLGCQPVKAGRATETLKPVSARWPPPPNPRAHRPDVRIRLGLAPLDVELRRSNGRPSSFR